jgi:S-adenosylmethionine decarboxylase
MDKPLVSNVFIKISDIPATTADTESFYCSLLEEIATSLGYAILKNASYKFAPHGVTAVLLLSESHISIHTWPEHNYAVCELVTCREFTSQNEILLRTILKETLKTDSISLQVIT